MYWNHRVIKRYYKKSDTVAYQIHEVYYEDDGAIKSWTDSPVEPFGETVEELQGDIRYFAEAFQKPVLEEQDDGKGKQILVKEK